MRVSRLPEIVPHRDGAVRYDATSRASMQTLSWHLRTLTGTEAVIVAASMLAQRVMFPPILFRVPEWIARKRGIPSLTFWSHFMCHRKVGQSVVDGVLSDAAHWAVFGKDREQKNSAGGFSQREVNFIAGVMATVRESIEQREEVA